MGWLTTRRSALGALSLVGLSALGVSLQIRPKPMPGAARLLRLVVARQSEAAALGRAYLQTRETATVSHDPAGQATALSASLQQKLALQDLSQDGDEEVLARYRRRLREDFAAARVVDVEGWVLAETECEVFALAALTG